MRKTIELDTDFQKYAQDFTGDYKITCFTISNTTKKIDQYYFTPIRSFGNIQIGGVVVNNSMEARQFACLADGRFNYIAVDSEKNRSVSICLPS